MGRPDSSIHAPRVLTITADNGTEFHDYQSIQRATGVRFYFATPHHAWERDAVYVIHAFEKRTPQIREADLALARKRLADFLRLRGQKRKKAR